MAYSPRAEWAVLCWGLSSCGLGESQKQEKNNKKKKSEYYWRINNSGCLKALGTFYDFCFFVHFGHEQSWHSSKYLCPLHYDLNYPRGENSFLVVRPWLAAWQLAGLFIFILVIQSNTGLSSLPYTVLFRRVATTYCCHAGYYDKSLMSVSSELEKNSPLLPEWLSQFSFFLF